jgi:hypothetical protein
MLSFPGLRDYHTIKQIKKQGRGTHFLTVLPLGGRRREASDEVHPLTIGHESDLDHSQQVGAPHQSGANLFTCTTLLGSAPDSFPSRGSLLVSFEMKILN